MGPVSVQLSGDQSVSAAVNMTMVAINCAKTMMVNMVFSL